MNGKAMEAKEIGGVLWLRASDVSEEIARVRSDTKTLRDYFAAKAMQAELIRLKNVLEDDDNDFIDGWIDVQEYAASLAYAMADAMLKARES